MVFNESDPTSLDFVSLCMSWVLSRFVYGKGLFSVYSSTRPNFFINYYHQHRRRRRWCRCRYHRRHLSIVIEA